MNLYSLRLIEELNDIRNKTELDIAYGPGKI